MNIWKKYFNKAASDYNNFFAHCHHRVPDYENADLFYLIRDFVKYNGGQALACCKDNVVTHIKGYANGTKFIAGLVDGLNIHHEGEKPIAYSYPIKNMDEFLRFYDENLKPCKTIF